jgi:hypothetical protein
MRMARPTLAVLLLTLTACRHRSPDLAVLAPLAAEVANGFSDQAQQPQYLIFADPLTASVLKNVERNSRYRIAPDGTPLLCPENRAEGAHGYEIHLTVDTLMGDRAITSIQGICIGRHQTLSTSETILVVRKSRKWAIDKVLSFSTGVLGMIAPGRLTNVAADKHFSDAASPQWL